MAGRKFETAEEADEWLDQFEKKKINEPSPVSIRLDR